MVRTSTKLRIQISKDVWLDVLPPPSIPLLQSRLQISELRCRTAPAVDSYFWSDFARGLFDNEKLKNTKNRIFLESLSLSVFASSARIEKKKSSSSCVMMISSIKFHDGRRFCRIIALSIVSCCLIAKGKSSTIS